jgi:adenine-specific DNA-methyltransferase
VPFVIACVALLAPVGRFAMVIPSELLHVLHATSLRSFLLEECSRIVIMDPNELLFDEALQGTVLLMLEKKVDKKQASKGVSIISAPNNDFLLEDRESIFGKAVFASGDILNGKWMKVLLEPKEIDVFESVAKSPKIKKFVEIASVDVGIVTGANKFFLVDNTTISHYKLEQYARPMFGRSEHCPGIIYDEKAHKKNQPRGLPTNFLMFGNIPFDKLTKRVQEYILMGEEQELHIRYKCRIRKPWYCVPSIYTTSVGMLKRSHNYPRLILNTADAYTTDTAYRIKPAEGITAKNLVYNFMNSLTALTAELEGRHYGGGVLELVPSEIEKLLIPAPNNKPVDIDSLNEKIRAGCDADSMLFEQDKIVLKNAGVSKSDQLALHEAWRRIRTRRQRLIGE